MHERQHEDHREQHDPGQCKAVGGADLGAGRDAAGSDDHAGGDQSGTESLKPLALRWCDVAHGRVNREARGVLVTKLSEEVVEVVVVACCFIGFLVVEFEGHRITFVGDFLDDFTLLDTVRILGILD